METDHFTKFVLAVIATELGAMGVRTLTMPVSARTAQHDTPTPVVIIAGIAVTEGSLPVLIAGTVKVTADQPLRIEAARPITVEATANRPLLTQSVTTASTRKPGVTS